MKKMVLFKQNTSLKKIKIDKEIFDNNDLYIRKKITKHDLYLEQLIKRLDDIGESPRNIAWIMKDGIWLNEGGFSKRKMPDLVLYYYSDVYTLIELKGSKCKRDKAKTQLNYGENFLKNFFNPKKIIKKFVVYNKDNNDNNYERFKLITKEDYYYEIL
jgi:hypothetical protein